MQQGTPAASALSALSGLQELWRRLLYVLLGVLVYRIGSHIPVSGLDLNKLAELFQQYQDSILGFANMFSGGALSRMSLFSLGVMPYISASIIIQLMTSSVPYLEQLKKEGDRGRRRINQYVRYLALLVSLFQGYGITKLLVSQSIVLSPSWWWTVHTVLTLATGSMFLVWLGEQMTERGIGNGISIIIFSGIVSRLPSAFGQIMEQVHQGQLNFFYLLLIAGIVSAITAVIVFMERAQRRVRIQYPKRQQGNRMYGGSSTHLPLKINMAGVIPPIFASAVITVPLTALNILSHQGSSAWLGQIALLLSPGHVLYMVFYAGLIIFFAHFYTALTYDPNETARNLKQSGALVPGMRPGQQTAQYLDTIMGKLTFIGAFYLTLVAIIPHILITAFHVSFYFGGTSLLIVVVVIMDIISRVQNYLLSKRYESLMKKSQGGSKSLGLFM